MPHAVLLISAYGMRTIEPNPVDVGEESFIVTQMCKRLSWEYKMPDFQYIDIPRKGSKANSQDLIRNYIHC